MLEHEEKSIDARTPKPRKSEAANGNFVLPPTDISDGLQIHHVKIDRFYPRAGYEVLTENGQFKIAKTVRGMQDNWVTPCGEFTT